MSSKNPLASLILPILLAGTLGNASAPSNAFAASEERLSLQLQNADIISTLKILAEKGGWKLELGTHFSNGTLNSQLLDVSPLEALDHLSEVGHLQYSLRGDTLFVSNVSTGTPSGRAAVPVTAYREPASANPTVGSGTAGVQRIQLLYSSAEDILKKLGGVLPADDKLMIDETTNSLIYVGSPANLTRVTELIRLFDATPRQILIEAQIVETSNNFLRSVGITADFSSNRSQQGNARAQAYVNAPGPASANAGFRYLLGVVDGRSIDLRLAAAESTGEAKVISRPKVVTLNNRAAQIQSGTSFNVKTLTTLPNSATPVVGGVTSLAAGLSLRITPTIVGADQVRLLVAINNSQPDEASSVDGIPGIINNSANTEVIVKNGKAAIIAGLIKQSKGSSQNRVPFLSDIPLIGYFFQSHSDTNNNNELVIFVTPSILGSEISTPPGSPETVTETSANADSLKKSP